MAKKGNLPIGELNKKGKVAKGWCHLDSEIEESVGWVHEEQARGQVNLLDDGRHQGHQAALAGRRQPELQPAT